ncbi:MAG: right-handed parallel beta-helix repeat-containing protein [Candidatus Bathyarchaeia archaeon]
MFKFSRSKFVIVVVLVSVLTIPIYEAAYAQPGSFVTTQTVQVGAAALVKPCSIQIFSDGTYTYMQGCSTGALLFNSTLAANVIDDAIGNLTAGGKLFIKAGTYTFTTTPINMGSGNVAAVGTTSVSNIELFGEGNSTILSAGVNMNGMVIGVHGGGGWYIHDLQINGNRVSQSASGTGTPQLNGIYLALSNNDVVERCYVHDNKGVGIAVGGTSERILNNYIANNNANGIILNSGSDYVIQDNIVNGASDVGISISGLSSGPVSNVICTENIVSNINLGISPWGGGSGIGITVGDQGYGVNVTISLNRIYETTNAIESAPLLSPFYGNDEHVLISGNQIHSASSHGIHAESTTDLSILGNVIDYVANYGIWTSMITGLSIKDNTITNITFATGTGIYIGSSLTEYATVSGNLVIGAYYGIYDYQVAYALIGNNHVEGGQSQIYTSGGNTSIVRNNLLNALNYAIKLDTGSDHSSAIGNTIYLAAGNKIGIVVNGLNCVVSGNTILWCWNYCRCKTAISDTKQVP